MSHCHYVIESVFLSPFSFFSLLASLHFEKHPKTLSSFYWSHLEQNLTVHEPQLQYYFILSLLFFLLQIISHVWHTRTCEIYSCVLLCYCCTEWFCLSLCVDSQPTVSINKLKRLFSDEKLWWSRAGYWPLTHTGSAAERLVACPSGTPERRAGRCARTWKHGGEPSKF